jgi:hypothetical protein
MPAYISEADLTNWFYYHEAKDQATRDAYKAINDAALEFARVIIGNSPSSPDQTVAVRAVREARMWANAAIACGGK